MLANLLTCSSLKPITFSEWKYVLTSNHLLLPIFLATGGIDSALNDNTNLYLRMVVDVNAKTGRHEFDSVQHLISHITNTHGLFRIFRGGTAQQSRMIGTLISSLVRYCGNYVFIIPSSIRSLLLPVVSSMIRYPFDTVSLTHLRSKQVRLFKVPKLSLNGSQVATISGNREIDSMISNTMNKARKVFEELETLKNKNGLMGLYRGFCSGYVLETLVSVCSSLIVGNIFDLFWMIWKGNSKNSSHDLTKTIINYSFSHLITAPVTFARMRYQCDFQNEYSSFFDCVNKIYKKEGWKAFYRGTFIALYIF